MDSQSRRALVTGAARGIGRSVADVLESRGISVLKPGRRELDLAVPESVAAYLAGLDAGVDIVVLNAGINDPQPLAGLSLGNWSTTQQVNVSANVVLLQALLPRMAAAGYGRVVAVSSVYAHRARLGRVAYSASKAAIEEVVRSVAVEYGPFGVLANCVAPGFVLTDLTYQNNDEKQLRALTERIPVGGLAEPDEIAHFVSWLASDENSYITGQSIAIDGGFLCV